MKYNIDFSIAATILLVVICLFQFTRKELPIRQNRRFRYLLYTELAVIVFNLSSSIADNYYTSIPLLYVTLLNMLFFIFFALRQYLFFLYCLSLTRFDGIKKIGIHLLYVTVFSIYVLILLSSPLNGLIFKITDQGYVSGPLYNLLYVLSAYYLILSITIACLDKKNLHKNTFYCILNYNMIILVGLLVRSRFMNYLLTDAFITLAIFVIYIVLQNPEYHLDHRSGLFNSTGCQKVIQERLNNHESFATLAIGIISYNDAKFIYGQSGMREAMHEMAKAINNTYDHAVVSYMSGGRFFILLEDDIDYVYERERIRTLLKKPFGKSKIYFTVSTCYLPKSVKMKSANDVNSTLYNGLLRASLLGENGYELIDENELEVLNHKAAVEKALHKAIDLSTIEVYIQPIYSTTSNKVTGGEALARLIDDELGFISPEEFIQTAEKNGLIIKLGEQILEKACQYISKYHLDEKLDYINVNLSPVQCMNETLPLRFRAITSRYRIPPHFIKLEITESTLIDTSVLVSQMDEFKDDGVEFVLDDYGTGYSNLVNIIQYPLAVIKLDMTLVRSYFDNENQLLPSIVSTFKSQNLMITAEGVETEEMAESLKKMKCDFLQGYYYAKPMPINEFVKFIESSCS